MVANVENRQVVGAKGLEEGGQISFELWIGPLFFMPSIIDHSHLDVNE